MTSLDEAIETQVNLGANDPLDVARKIEKLHGAEWLAEQVAPLAFDIAVDRARQVMSSRRRSAEIALRPGDEHSQNELRLQKFWVPTGDGSIIYKAAHLVTPDDFDARATYYERLAGTILSKAAWYRECAELMRSEGVRTLGKLKAPLPAIERTEPLALEAAV